MPYVTSDRSLPRSLDVQISLSRPQAETRTDLSIMAVALEDLGFLPDSNRVRFYSTIEAVENDFPTNTEAYQAASAFFAQSPRPPQMALGEVFLDDLPAQLVSGAITDAEITATAAVTDGSMDITYDPGTGAATATLSTMDFTGVTTVSGLVSVIQAGIVADASDGDITCTVKTLPGDDERIAITTIATGDSVTITYPVAGAAGTFVGDLLNLTSAEGGNALNGHTAVDIADELASIQNAAYNSGSYLYGWTLGATLREVSVQTTAAEWVLPRVGIMTLVTNDITALDPSFTADLGSVLQDSGNRRAVVLYHDNAQRYPDVSILAYMLHVNYRLQDSTVTAKFKELPGIETVQLTETEWGVLQSKGINTYTSIGNDARTYRDGVTEASGWWMDTVINLDNFVEDLSVNVFNVFLRNKKVPYTRGGQALLVDACQDTGYQYTYNGTFADREELDTTVKSGVSVTPAVQVIPTPVAQATAADRTARIAPPIQIIGQESGAMHEVAINVEIVS